MKKILNSLIVITALLSFHSNIGYSETEKCSLLDAREKGAFNIGSSQGRIVRQFDESLNKDVIQFNYNCPDGTAVGVWTKSYPTALNADTVNDIKIGVNVPEISQLGEIDVKLEVKGTKSIQNIFLNLKQGWNSVIQNIKWNMIGDFKEVVFAVLPKHQGNAVSGVLYFDFEFGVFDILVIDKNLDKQNIQDEVKVDQAVKEEGKIGEVNEQKFNIPLNIGIKDAEAFGTFNIGKSQGTANRRTDKTLNREVLSLNYTAPLGSMIGVWTKSYPKGLKHENIEKVKIGVNVTDIKQKDQIAVKVEVKGNKSAQTIPFYLKSGWNYVEESIDWALIGDINEVVFVVSTRGGGDVLTGTLDFDLEFGKLTILQKRIACPKKKLGYVLFIGLLIAFFGIILNFLFGKKSGSDCKCNNASIKRDFLYGFASVLIAVVVLSIYSLGKISTLDAGMNFIFIGITGAIIAQLFKWAITGKNLTGKEIFQNIFITGLLATASSSQTLLQAPLNWTQVFLKSNLTAAVACLLYHFLNAYTMCSSGRHIRFTSGALIAGTPFMFGWLLILETAGFVASFANGITFGMFASNPVLVDILGRFLIVFVFNEIVANGIGLATKSRCVKSKKAHIVMACVSLSVVIAPYIANIGSTLKVAELPVLLKLLTVILTTIFSQAGLWAEVYLITGLILSSTRGAEPCKDEMYNNSITGAKKGMAYSGIVMFLLYGLKILIDGPIANTMMSNMPIAIGIVFGALIFPLFKTIIETFDGSQAFFGRVRYNYKEIVLYARGAIFGFGLSYAISNNLFAWQMGDRVLFGLGTGLAASMGISLIRDIVNSFRKHGEVRTWKVYFIDALLGGFIGSALAFYLDTSQVAVVVAKFKLYNSSGFVPKNFPLDPLVSKWGHMELGTYTGGVKLFFNEALAGVINWSVAAWLFAINRTFLQAIIQKDKTPIKFFFSKQGFVELIHHMLFVLRWGLWMSPIINTFLRMMPEPTWYNQDGAIRTVVAVVQNATLSPEAFKTWSLGVFVSLLAHDFLRVLIWIDHMGLRVATLVNLSFIGMDKLDEKIARFIGKSSAQSYIPEAVKRFTTWGPLLLPFYIPRGPAWDYAWAASQTIQNAAFGGGIVAFMQSLMFSQKMSLFVGAIFACTIISVIIRVFKRKFTNKQIGIFDISNREYKVIVKENGGGFSTVTGKEYDISRSSFDTIDPCGRVLYLVDADKKPESKDRSWPVLGNYPKDKFETSTIEKDDECLRITNTSNDIKTKIEITLPDTDDTVEIWDVEVSNLSDKSRSLKIIPYLEWQLGKGADDRFHTQYARLFPEMAYESAQNAILAWRKNTQSMGILASDIPSEGFLSSRMDFIGRAHSIWSPRVVQTLDFLDARDTEAYPTFDPIGSLNIGINVSANSSKTVRFMIGMSDDKQSAIDLINKYLSPKGLKEERAKEKRHPLIGHGEILPGTPQPYSEYTNNGDTLFVKTPYTTRPYDHAMSNALGHFVMVTNRGLHTSSNGNSQQNRITPDCPDTVTREIPGEAIYLYDINSDKFYSPTHQPLNDHSAENTCKFTVDGSAVFNMKKKELETELTVFVPPNETVGVYLLKIKNKENKAKQMRVAPFFQIVLSGQPEWAGPLGIKKDEDLNALFFTNPRNSFRKGPAYASISIEPDLIETCRGKFFGQDRGVDNPYMVQIGVPDEQGSADDRPIAGFLGTIEIPANGEFEFSMVLGQTDNRKMASAIIEKYKSIDNVKASLKETRAWWLSLMGTTSIKTNKAEFDNMHNWLKYQAMAERIWARRGFYQTSGAFGFRDQLQDTVNLMWVDPALARRQILLHSSQQFIEGDVVHWFHTLHDGRTGFSNRSHASDNLLWLAWGTVEYLSATSDESILDELTTYLKSDLPFKPLPHNKHGWGTIYQRSSRGDTLYRHCLKSIDLVFNKRMGVNGLPLIGTGDWNDGLDEIGSEGRGESVWLGFFLYYILDKLVDFIEKKDGKERKDYYLEKMNDLERALEATWRGDRYLRAFHDDGTEIGIKGSGIWEIDALTAAWAVKSGINPERGITVFDTAIDVLEKGNVVLLGWPALREDTKPYLGRSCKYPEGVRENGMYCHGVQWLIKAARVLVEHFDAKGDKKMAEKYREASYRLWRKITPVAHVTPHEIEIYGGQPNKQQADVLTNYDCGRMIWNGYTGASGWLLRQAYEGVVGAKLVNNKMILPADLEEPRGQLKIKKVFRDLDKNAETRKKFSYILYS